MLSERRGYEANRSHGWMTLCVACAVLLGLVFGAGAASAYSGSLTTSLGGIQGTGNWFINGSTISWNVDAMNDGSWLYHYSFTHGIGETSHFILETSRTFTSDDIWGATGSFGSYDVGEQRVGSGNPNMPETVYGIRFEETWGLTSAFRFYSSRAPVWGDFYAKDGNAGGLGQNSVWNAGFTANDWDPSDAPTNGSIGNHLLVPDTYRSVPTVPEPGSVLLLGVGCIGVAAVGVFRRRRATQA